MRAIAALLLTLCACSGGGGETSAPPPPPPPPASGGPAVTLVSTASPLPAACGGAGGTLYVNAEVEPHIAIDPLDANHWIGVWQQDRWSNGSSRAVVAAVTFDGGATWQRTAMPFSQCAGGADVRATDPWVTFGAGGRAYQSSVSTTGATFAAGSSNAVLVARSLDGGRSWQPPVEVIRDGAGAFSDKETITADPADARFAYAVWDRLVKGGNGPTWFARTVDGGATWEAAHAIYDPGANQQTIGNVVRVLPDGTLVNLMARLATTDTDDDAKAGLDDALEVIRSTDHGATWSGPIRVADFRPLGASDPLTGTPIRDGSIIPQMAVAPGGSLYVVWQDARFAGARDAIAMSRSTDGGLTWSAPARVNADPSVPAFTPQVHVSADGTIGVSYFDLRSRSADPLAIATDYWLARSSDGVQWTETRIDGPFDLASAPRAAGALFLGDYMGLASAGGTFVPFYVRTTGNASNPTDVFAARLPAAARSAKAYTAAPLAGGGDAGLDRRVRANLRRALDSRTMR